MRRASGSDHLAHSFTDLMTSLMVIFILLLLIFMNNQASVNSVTTRNLLAELRKQLEPAGFKREDIRIDPKDPSSILLTMLDAQLTFQPDSHQLQPEGERFLATRMPKLAETLCADQYRASVEAIVVEGHSDSAPYRGLSVAESQARNLKLSQDRSMEVVGKTLTSLSQNGPLRTCVLEKISANGRGEQDAEETAEKSRRAVIKIRVNALHAIDLANSIHAEAHPQAPVPVPTPGSDRILDLAAKLQAVPKQHLSFRLTEEEVNQYLVFSLQRTPRPGVDSISVKFFPYDYVSALIVIDFDAVEKWSPGLVPGFLGLNGKQAIWADVRFTTKLSATGVATASYTIEKAFYQNRRLPDFLADKVVQTLGARQPEGFDADHEILLPLGLRSIHTGDHYVEAEN